GRIHLPVALRTLTSPFAAHGPAGLSETGKPADDGRLQGAWRTQQAADAVPGWGEVWGDRGERRQPCPGGGVSRHPSPYQGPHRDARAHAPGQGDGDPRLRRRGNSSWHEL